MWNECVEQFEGLEKVCHIEWVGWLFCYGLKPNKVKMAVHAQVVIHSYVSEWFSVCVGLWQRCVMSKHLTDLAVGAPFMAVSFDEDAGTGVVYIYMGSKEGLGKDDTRQVIIYYFTLSANGGIGLEHYIGCS